MKLQHLAVIFIIIVLPITLILSQYIQTQIDMQVIIERYTTSLLNATHDAMTAYELNTMNNNYSEDANSKKRDVQASINTFFTSLANNLGVPGYIKQDIEPYIPAVVFTGYDGYYIYAKTSQLDRYTKEDEENGKGEEGEIITNPTITETNEYALKPYIYYSAQYRNRNGDIDVTINYTLDNYITVYGNVESDGYISMSGYLLNSNETYKDETLKENVVCKRRQVGGGEGFVTGSFNYYYIYTPQSKTMQKVYYNNSEGKYFTVSNAGDYQEVSDYQEVNNIIDLDRNNTRKIITSNNVLNDLYDKNKKFTNDYILNKLGNLTINDMVVDNNGTRIRLESVTDSKNPYYNLKSNAKIFESNLVQFNEHKKDIIKISIQENLKSALANYQLGETTYKLPILSETDWAKIYSNISVIAFMQDMPVSNGTYNNYVIATSTGNKEYVPDDGIYFIDTNNTYHRITCPILQEEIKNEGVNAIIGYKALEFERNKITIDNTTENFYPHNESACYECIVSSNYESLYDDNGNFKITDDAVKEVYYTALARERVTQYKPTTWLSNN